MSGSPHAAPLYLHAPPKAEVSNGQAHCRSTQPGDRIGAKSRGGGVEYRDLTLTSWPTDRQIFARNIEEHIPMTNPVRISPIAPENFTAEQATLVGEWKHLIFSRVLVNSPRMYRTFIPHLEELISRTALTARDRQIVCLRMLELCNEVYEKTHHVTISRKIGMSEADIFAVLEWKGAEEGNAAETSLTDADLTVINATDELYHDQCISDVTWNKLAESYSQDQLMDIVFLAGCYLTMGMLTKSFGIQLEPDLESFNALRDYA